MLEIERTVVWQQEDLKYEGPFPYPARLSLGSQALNLLELVSPYLKFFELAAWEGTQIDLWVRGIKGGCTRRRGPGRETRR